MQQDLYIKRLESSNILGDFRKAGFPLGEIARAMQNLSMLRMRSSSLGSEVDRFSDRFGSSIEVNFLRR